MILRIFLVWLNTIALPDTNVVDATQAVHAAFVVETHEIPAELLIAIAWGESRFNTTTRTGIACGPMQSIQSAASDCERWADPISGFAAGVDELTEWSRDRRTQGDLELVLLGQACGNAAFNGTCTKTRWPGWVLRRARRLGMQDVRPSS